MTGHPSLNFILKLLQLCGLGPFLTINYHHKIVQVTLLIFYNLCLVAFLTYNTVTGFLKNGRIASGCTRRSTLIKISFDVADLLENFHFSFIGLRCLVFLGKGNSLWLNLVKVDDKFRKLEAEFNEKAMTLCLCAATVLHLSIYFIFLKANDTVIGFHDLHDNTYSMFYAPPLLLNTLLNVAFNAFTLILHQRFWVINQFLKSFLVYYRNEKLTMTLRQLDWRNADYSIEKSISKHRSRRISPLWRSMRNKTGPLGLVKNGKQPFWVMLKDDYCFTQSFYRRHNNSVDFVRQLKILHFRLYEVTDSLNSVFGYNLLFIFGISFFGCIINFYFVIVYHLRSDQADQYVTCVYWMFYYIIRVILIILCTNSASAEANRTQDVLHNILNNTNFTDLSLQEELKAFCMQIYKCKVRFKAAGFFDIDFGTFFQFVAGVFSNVLFMIQFSKTNLKAIENHNETEDSMIIYVVEDVQHEKHSN